MIFWNNQLLAYGKNPDPQEMNKFAMMILTLGHHFRNPEPPENAS